MKFGVRVSLIAVALALALVSCGKATPAPAPAPAAPAAPAPTAAPAKVIKFQFGSIVAPGAAQADGEQYFADEVKRRTNGRVEIEIGWVGAFGDPKELLRLISTGALPIGQVVPGYTPGEIHFREFFNDLAWHWRDAQTTLVAWAMLQEEFPDILEREVSEKNLKPLIVYPVSPYIVYGNKRATRLADFQGTKVRSFGKYTPLLIKGLGAVPVSVMTPEWYESMERGTVDYMIGVLDIARAFGLHEVSKYVIENVNLGSFLGGQIFMNLDTWKGLPPDIQDIMTQVGKEVIFMDAVNDIRGNADAREFFKAQGIEFLRLPDEDIQKWHENVGDPNDAFLKELEKVGLGDRGRPVVERLKQMAQW